MRRQDKVEEISLKVEKKIKKQNKKKRERKIMQSNSQINCFASVEIRKRNRPMKTVKNEIQKLKPVLSDEKERLA